MLLNTDPGDIDLHDSMYRFITSMRSRLPQSNLLRAAALGPPLYSGVVSGADSESLYGSDNLAACQSSSR